MIKFRRLTLDDIPVIRQFFKYQIGRICDCTVGGTFMWRDYFDTHYAIVENSLVFMVDYLNDQLVFTYPLGEDIAPALDALFSHCCETNTELVFCMTPRTALSTLHAKYSSVEYAAKGEWSDYLYDAKDIMLLKGKRYNGQRNHINRFKRNYPDYTFTRISQRELPAVREFFTEYMQNNQKEGELFAEENAKVLEVIDNYGVYGLNGGVLKVGNTVAGFSIGEIINDTLFVHIEKADRAYDGAYTMLVNCFANEFVEQGVFYINREEDDGDQGLRTSKLSYHPVDILEKFTVAVNALE